VFSQKIAEAEMAKDPILARQLQGQQEIMQLGIKIASELEKEKNTTAQLAMAREFQAKKALALLGIEIDIAKIKQQQTEQYNTIISDLDTELALKYAITEQERTQLRIAAEMRKLELSDPYLTESQRVQIQQDKERLAAPKTGRELVLERTGALEDELKSLTDVGNVAITVAAGIGDAFAMSFKGIIDGSMTAKEALGNFFKSVADMFLEMAAQIIAKQITMIILQTILKALGAVAGGGGGANSASALGTNPNVAAYSGTEIGDIGIGTFANANGNAFGANGVASFANGGAFTNSIVSSPTMFKFADGGAMRTGLMGEAGPEAIMPLKRGADGSLGVQANGLREAMDRQQGGGSGSPVLNMSFQSTSINGVEYVSREQLEFAMAETRRASTRDGAKRGMTMTLDRIQNSSSTRRKVGI
jgi:lambda family phage tail tape measure protein